jgi:hypothetical protein
MFYQLAVMGRAATILTPRITTWMVKSRDINLDNTYGPLSPHKSVKWQDFASSERTFVQHDINIMIIAKGDGHVLAPCNGGK